MTFDVAVPESLKSTQVWFAGIITQAIDEDSQINPLTPRGLSIEEEAPHYIRPSPTLRPAARIELYNQQYWWRLLSTLQENFPFLTRLFGYHEFNQVIAFPYLLKYPSRHWSLNFLGDRLVQWAKEDYHQSDRDLIIAASEIDLKYCESFLAGQEKAVGLNDLPVPGDVESLLTARLYLQPHIQLFVFKSDYFALRQEMLDQSVEYWVENDFPNCPYGKKNRYFILFRNRHTNLVYKEISEAEYKLLGRFKVGSSIEKCCDWLEKQTKASFKNAEADLQKWFQEWTSRGWLCR